MYCPKCSQEQVSDEMRFCSRCGFSLSAVRKLVASGSGVIEPEPEAPAGKLSLSQRRVRKGACMMLMSLPLTLVVALLTAINDGFALFGILPVLCFVIGFLRVLHGVFLTDKRARSVKGAASQSHLNPMPARQASAARSPELLPPRVAPIQNFTAQRAQTAEMIQPPSVTENTTRLLDEESNRG